VTNRTVLAKVTGLFGHCRGHLSNIDKNQ